MKRPLTLGLVLAVMACFAFNSVATRYLVSHALLDLAAVTIARFAAGAGMLAAILAPQKRGRDALPRAGDWPLVVFLGGYALAIAYGYRYITAAAGTFVFSVPILTAALGIVALDEPLTARLGIAGALVLCGMWLTTQRSARAAPAGAAAQSAKG